MQKATFNIESMLTERNRIDGKITGLVRDLTAAVGLLGYKLVPHKTNGAVPTGADWLDKPAAPADYLPPVPKTLICNDCGRTFSLPVHLGRHRTATHMKRRRVNRRGRSGGR